MLVVVLKYLSLRQVCRMPEAQLARSSTAAGTGGRLASHLCCQFAEVNFRPTEPVCLLDVERLFRRELRPPAGCLPRDLTR